MLTYRKLLEVWNTSRWEGWQRIPQPNGAAAFITDNVSNYYKVGLKTATTTSSGGTNTGLIVGIVVLLLCRRPRAEEG